MRRLSLVLAGAAAAVLMQPAIGEEAHTTRIEMRPYYGAVVSIEHGVRVFRPLPPTEHLIINPGGATPLALGGYVAVGSPPAPSEPKEEQDDD